MDTKTAKPRSNLLEDEVIVRKARPDDISEIYTIMKPLLEDGFEGPSPWFHILLAEQAGEVVGAAVFYRSYWSWTGRTVHLHAMRVRSAARRRGVGSRLFRELCRVSVEENAQLDWSHAASNYTARAFFMQFKKSYINSNLDGIHIMRIALHTYGVANVDKRSNEEITVRMARPEDMIELKKMIHEISAFQELSDGPQLHEKDLVEDAFTSSPPWFFGIVACRRGNVVGAVMGNRSYHNWSRSFYLQSLYVRPSARRCGIADRLVIAFNQVALEKGAQYVYFHVSPDNAPALALYKRYHAVRTASDDVAFRLDRSYMKDLEILN